MSVPTGVGGSTRSLATVLAGLEGEVRRVLAGPPIGRFVALVRDQGAAEEHLAVVSPRRTLRPLHRAWTAARLARWASRHRRDLDAIHANGLKELSLSLPAALVSRARLVVWVHNFLLPPSVRWFGWLWRLLLPRCDVRWAAVSPLARDLVVEAGLTTAGAVRIVPNPIDPADVVAAERPPAGGPVTAAYLGAPRAYKGFQDLPAIVEAVPPDAPVRWLVFSHPTDDDLAATWDALRDLEAAGRLEVRGKLTDVRQAYARCDVVVCPSLRDSFCRVAAEAMLNGIPVVGSDLPPIRDLLGEDEAGLLVPPRAPVEAAKAVVRLAEDPDLRAHLGAEGRRRAAAYAPTGVCEALLGLYLAP
ncbi:MAG TPA: glycosyltransferase family 4 protein [Acidimicrobiales bacterium]|nr:glycosyltransferase family 4 protein [Acidimicrobiales bacterium]